MYISRSKWPSKDGKKVYESIWLRESYRKNGKVKTRNIANLKHCKPEEITAIELALKNKKNLSALVPLNKLEIKEGQSIGALWVLHHLAIKIGLTKALGNGFDGKLALWQVMARVMDQGSRLSAVRMASQMPAVEVMGLSRGFDENDLYKNLSWLYDHQEVIENRLFSCLHGEARPELFLYDVTSSYLEGDKNELSGWGYNRDRKRGKKQIVVGLLCDSRGVPVSVEVFEGNKNDLSTFKSQIRKTASRFKCEKVTMVGDRGMIKSGQMKDLEKTGFHYITAVTRGQIRSLIKKGAFQLDLFDEHLCEVTVDQERYILRRNPLRADEMYYSRIARIEALSQLAKEQTQYLAEHPRAKETVAGKRVLDKASRLKLNNLINITAGDRQIKVVINEKKLSEIAELDGCYALKTDLPSATADTETVHARYKDLAKVERAFRTMKTGLLEIRPVYVRKAGHTRAHVLVVMLAYLLVRELEKKWAKLEITVEEGLNHLRCLCAVEVGQKGFASLLRIPEPGHLSRKLLSALDVKLPSVFPKSRINVGTRKKIGQRR